MRETLCGDCLQPTVFDEPVDRPEVRAGIEQLDVSMLPRGRKPTQLFGPTAKYPCQDPVRRQSGHDASQTSQVVHRSGIVTDVPDATGGLRLAPLPWPALRFHYNGGT